MKWTDKPLVLIDTETTGVDIEAARIWEIAAIIVPNLFAAPTDNLSSLVASNTEIPAEVQRICGLSAADLKDVATANRDLKNAFDWIRGYVPDGAIWVAYNGHSYDFPLICNEIKRATGQEPVWPKANQWLDPLILIRHLFPGWQGRTLSDAYRRLCSADAPIDAHRAAADCLMTLRVLRALVPRLPNDWDDLSALQDLVLTAQQADFAKYGIWIRTAPAGLRMGCGKWAGTLVSRTDHGYLRWVLTKEAGWDQRLTPATRMIFRQTIGLSE